MKIGEVVVIECVITSQSQSDQKTRKFFIFPDYSLADNTLCYTIVTCNTY